MFVLYQYHCTHADQSQTLLYLSPACAVCQSHFSSAEHWRDNYFQSRWQRFKLSKTHPQWDVKVFTATRAKVTLHWCFWMDLNSPDPRNAAVYCSRLTLDINASSWEINCQRKHNCFFRLSSNYIMRPHACWLATFHSQMWFYTVSWHHSILAVISSYITNAFHINAKDFGMCSHRRCLMGACTLQENCVKKKKKKIRIWKSNRTSYLIYTGFVKRQG